MKKLLLAVLFIVSGAAFGQTGLKAGLWEMKIVHLVVDGQDKSAQIAAGQARMEQQLANLPPEKRKQVESMMGGMQGHSGAIRVCISPAMAARNESWTSRDGHCGSSKLSVSGNRTTFEINCSRNGRTTVGTGQSTHSGDTISTHVDFVETDSGGKHTTVGDFQHTFVGSDCQGVTPADQLAKGMH
jgi:uncharacterized lipoprotein NlpE involved in copper resistance